MTQLIEIIVSPTGQATVQTKGFVGGQCRDASRELEQALGAQLAEKLTSEFYESSVQQQSLQEGT